MSAYVVAPDTIDLLTGAIDQWNLIVYTADERRLCGRTDYARMGAELWAENVKSVNYRYQEDSTEPGYMPDNLSLDYACAGMSPELLVLGSIRCLRYQSCEHPDYPESLGAKILDALEHEAISRLCNINDSPWGYTRQWTEERRAAVKAKIARLMIGIH